MYYVYDGLILNIVQLHCLASTKPFCVFFFLIPFRLSFINLSKPHICNVQLNCFCWGMPHLSSVCVCVLHVPQAILPFIQRYHWKPVFWLQQQPQQFEQIFNQLKSKKPTKNVFFFHPNSLICSQNNIILCSITATTYKTYDVAFFILFRLLSIVWFESK